MATVNKDFRIKAGLVVEGANATVNGEDVITTGSSTDNLQEGTTNLYFTAERAATAVADEISTAVSNAINALDTDAIEEGTTNLYFTAQRAIDAGDGVFDGYGAADAVATDLSNHISDTSTHGVTGDIVGTSDAQSLSNKTFQGQVNFQSGGGAGGTNNHINVDNSTGKMTVESGYSLDLKADGVVSIISNANDIVLNADGDSYIGSVASGNQIATQSDIDTAVNGLAPNYITSTTSEFSVTDGELSLDSLSGQTQINPASGAQPDNGYGTIEYVDTDAGNERLKISADHGWTGGNVGGNLELHAYNNINLNTNNGDIVLNPDGNSYLGSVASDNAIATKGYVDSLAGNYDAAGAASQALTDANSYTDTAVANLVDSAPELLNTLNELAAAIADNPNYATDMATSLSNKQDTLTASTGITIDGSNNISVTANTYDAYGAASTAESNANDYTDTAISGLSTVYDSNGAASSALSSANSYTDTAISGLSSVYDALGAASTAESNANDYTDTAISGLSSVYDASGAASTAESNANNYTDGVADDITNGVTAFSVVNINSVASQVAATQTVSSASTVTGLSWAKSEFKSAKLMVKAANSTNSQVSEVLVTLDSSNNVAVTEFGIVYTDVELATVDADVSGSDVRIRVTTLGSATTVTVVGTLLV